MLGNPIREQADNWEERTKLLAFTAELQRLLETEGDTQDGDRQLSQWIDWAREKATRLSL